MKLKTIISVIFMICLMIFMTEKANAQCLGASAIEIKKVMPEDYEAIKNRAIELFYEDTVMVCYEINKQANAYMLIFNYYVNQPDFDKNKLVKALVNWQESKKFNDVNYALALVEYKLSMKNGKQ